MSAKAQVAPTTSGKTMTSDRTSARTMPVQSTRSAVPSISARPVLRDRAHVEEPEEDAEAEGDHRLGDRVRRVVQVPERPLHEGAHHLGRGGAEHVGEGEGGEDPED